MIHLCTFVPLLWFRYASAWVTVSCPRGSVGFRGPVIAVARHRCAQLQRWTRPTPFFGDTLSDRGKVVVATATVPNSYDHCLSDEPMESVILVIGSCGMDRLLAVDRYPEQDTKIRSSWYREVGGGNGANTAYTMALLSECSFLSNRPRIRFYSKVGDDNIGQQVMVDLDRAGVDLSGSLFSVAKGTTTGFTTVIVNEEQATRTCIHTPGTCGELTTVEVARVNMDDVFKNVIHLHSDSRHTDVALQLAREARIRGIPVSLDVEKDRNTKALDELLEVATTVFTNAGQIETYLHRLTNEMESKHKSMPLTNPVTTTNRQDLDDLDASLFVHAMQPSIYFTRWYQQRGKQVVITKGHKGAVSLVCESIIEQTCSRVVSLSLSNQIDIAAIDLPDKLLQVQHTFQDESTNSTKTFSSKYTIRSVGVVSSLKLVDTTGAGDAFIGGFILAKCASNLPDGISDYLRFGSWVAGKKLGGEGARTALPKSLDVDNNLGSHASQVHNSLITLLTPFRRTGGAP